MADEKPDDIDVSASVKMSRSAAQAITDAIKRKGLPIAVALLMLGSGITNLQTWLTNTARQATAEKVEADVAKKIEAAVAERIETAVTQRITEKHNTDFAAFKKEYDSKAAQKDLAVMTAFDEMRAYFVWDKRYRTTAAERQRAQDMIDLIDATKAKIKQSSQTQEPVRANDYAELYRVNPADILRNDRYFDWRRF